MNYTDKDTLRQLIVRVEQLIREYQQEYPFQLKDMILKKSYTVLWITAVFFLLFCRLSSLPKETIEHIYLPFGTICFILACVIFLICKSKTIIYKKSTRIQTYKKLQEITDNYGHIPDIKGYLYQCRKDLRTIDEQKDKIKDRFKTIAITYYIVVGLFALPLITPKSTYEALLNRFILHDKYRDEKYNVAYNERSNGLYYDNLHLKKYQPFITLKPQNKVINDSLKIASNAIDIYLDEGKIVRLITMGITIEGLNKENCKIFRLIITDINGNPVKHAPFIDFTLCANSRFKEYSYACYYDVIKENLYYSRYHNDYETLRMLQYLKDNQDNLRFMVQEMDKKNPE